MELDQYLRVLAVLYSLQIEILANVVSVPMEIKCDNTPFPCRPQTQAPSTLVFNNLDTTQVQRGNKSNIILLGSDLFPSASWLIAAAPSFPAQHLGANPWLDV